MSRHRCFAFTTPAGNTARINGDPNMSEETRAAFTELIDAVHAMIERGEYPKEPQEQQPKKEDSQ